MQQFRTHLTETDDRFKKSVIDDGSVRRTFEMATSATMTPWRRGLIAIVSSPSRIIYARYYSVKTTSDPTTHFGFRTIPSEQKEQMGIINYVYAS